MSRDINHYVSRALAEGIPKDEFKSALTRMSAALKSSGRWADAAKALEFADAPVVSICDAYAKAALWMNAVDCLRRAEGINCKFVKDLLKQRAQGILDDVVRKSEEIERYARRLEVVRSIKEERITKIKEGVESGKDLEDIDVFSDAGSAMSVVSRRTSKSGVSRASTTATVRKRKQIERKKSSLKEGGEYEDSALLLAIAAHYKWINDVIAELLELLPALVGVDELELASSVQSSVDRLITTAVSRRPHIWPQKLHPRDLPGPLYALYSVNDVFVFPEDGGMPTIIALVTLQDLIPRTPVVVCILL
ncbi:hypothetical protein ANCCAN_14883 [Ancylostoma caninum]|uniref:ELP1 three-helical bundle domain-containing protein n=1 Tax=Ancylostoma caninum TaxID=29170 RepID=A0A368G7B3_ANCCA|nr:hypothetical protein ANCCAN_14883 [Ancylostoma caninum]